MITILVPAYNEEESIERLVAALDERVKLDEPYEILIVNDGSSDGTPIMLSALEQRYPQLRVVHHAKNQGLGRALQTGFHEARGRIIVTMDADLTHPPEMIKPLLDACTGDFAVASRYVPGGGMARVPAWRVALSRVANGIFQLMFFTRLRDITAGFKAYRAERVQSMKLAARGFEVQLEITVRLITQGATCKEVPYVLTNRERGASKMRYLQLIPVYATTLWQLFRHRWHLGSTPYDA